ncbi:hypothetical protein BZA05DRAFT_380351 [Tricharina praecox]|uniref:uncharacterized protein n=1 Tax=Tricharina praecox TaxID=43433 RepID=UPI00221F9E08|nr:uncharacterized protein BZA05DRAFT_380351 [Tricharina praecox]KAI5841639.1 hypothetical protein BZA05DRAFT_380351 [Tricharina praecox]
MDPLSLAVSAITVVQVAAKVISFAVAYGKSVSALPEEVQSLVSEIGLVSKVLTNLHDTLKGIAADEKTGLVVSKTDFLKPHMDECQEQLLVLASFLEKGRSKKARLKNFGKRLKWPMQVAETQEWIVRMERFKGSFLLVLETEKLVVNKKMCSEVVDIKVAQERERAERRREKQIQNYRDAVAWLSAVDPRENHDAAKKLQQKGTGKWLIESASFFEWKSADRSFMWLSGGAGTGKTILSSLIIDALIAEGIHKPIYFYCDFKDIEKMTRAGIYASLTAQILAQKWTELPAHFAEYYENNKSKPFHDWSLREQLLILIGMMGRGRIVVDALDECAVDVRRDVLMTLGEIYQKGQINVLVTSRDEIDIKLGVEIIGGSKTCIKVKASATQSDLALFVNGEIERNGTKLARLKESTKREIEATLTGQADGMFRWAKCSLDYISRMRNDKSIKQALNSLPPGLNETYDRILARILDTDRAIAMRIFNWLTCSQRPLLVAEVVEAISIELGSRSLDRDTLLNDPEDLLDVCGSLLEIDHDAGTVVLGHFSVKEYLTSLGLRNGKYSEYFVDVRLTNFCLAKLCVTYLCFEDFASGPCEKTAQYEERCQSHSLYQYAAHYWPEHAKEHGDIDDEPFLSIMEHFFLGPGMDGNFEAWMQAHHTSYREHTQYLTSDRGPGNRLVYAARFGLYSTVLMMLSKGHDPNTICEYKGRKERVTRVREGHCGTPLIAAVESGNIKVVELLLSRGADVNTVAGNPGSAINMAIRHGRRDDYALMRYLLQHGADVNHKAPNVKTPLSRAIETPSLEATKICLEAGADVSVRSNDTDDHCMLDLACFYGGPQIFDLLWEHGAGEYSSPPTETKPTPGIDGWSLFYACWPNFFETAQKILEKNGDKLFKDPTWMEPLLFVIRSSAAYGYYKFLEQLMAYAGTSSDSYTIALQEAARNGREKTVGMLLDIGTSESNRGCPLVLAAAIGNRKTVGRLLEAGEDPLALNEHGWSALLAATIHKQPEIVELFNSTGKYLASGESSALPPTSWQISTKMLEFIEVPYPKVEFEGWEAHSLPENTHKYVIYTDHPLAPRTGYCYYEITILEAGTDFYFQIGLFSNLAHYEIHDPSVESHMPLRSPSRALSYSHEGEIKARDTSSSDNPTLSAGSVIGCAVNLELGLAYFTCDGKLVDVPCGNVIGMVHPAIYISPGTKIKANFGEEKFRFDTSVLETLDYGVEPKVRFEIDEDPVELMYDFRRPVKMYIG